MKQFYCFLFCPPSQKGSALRGKNLLLWEQILSLKSGPCLEKLSSSCREAMQLKVTKVFPPRKNDNHTPSGSAVHLSIHPSITFTMDGIGWGGVGGGGWGGVVGS